MEWYAETYTQHETVSHALDGHTDFPLTLYIDKVKGWRVVKE